MDAVKQKVIESSNFYADSFLNFDYSLADYGFKTLQPFFKGKTALEVGPASGYMTKYLVKEFETLDLVEGSEELLNQIPDYPNVSKNHAMIEEFEPTKKYDTIIMSHVLEHVHDPVAILQRIRTWLKDDGVFLVAVPNAKSIHRMVAVQMGLLKNEYELNERDHSLGHYRVYDTANLKKDVLAAGYSIIEAGGYYLKPLTNGQIEKNWTPEMIEGFYNVGKFFPENCAEIFIICSK